jgi:hypothetical protein
MIGVIVSHRIYVAASLSAVFTDFPGRALMTYPVLELRF